jgi:hypothetical protein
MQHAQNSFYNANSSCCMSKMIYSVGTKSCWRVTSYHNSFPLNIYAFHIRLIASVTPTSFVSNSYNPTATVRVAALNVHQRNFLVFGKRLLGM